MASTKMVQFNEQNNDESSLRFENDQEGGGGGVLEYLDSAGNNNEG